MFVTIHFSRVGMETPAHERVEAGAIHKAHGGVLFIDEINLLRLARTTSFADCNAGEGLPNLWSLGVLLVLSPRPRPFHATSSSSPRGNLDAVQHMHPALRSRIRGYGYEVYVNSTMRDTARNRRRLIRFIAQEVRNEQTRKQGTPFLISVAVQSKSFYERHSVEPGVEGWLSPCAYVSWVDWSESQVTWRVKKMLKLSVVDTYSGT